MTHARFRPSSAARTMQCPVSVMMQATQPDEDSPEAIAGRVAHEVAMNIHLGEIMPPETDAEMIEGGDLWAATLASYGDLVWHLEEYADYPHIHANNGGTPDAWAMHGTTLIVADYKFGHRFVQVIKNWQLLNYAAGVAGQLLPGEFERVEMVVVQPRSFHASGPVNRWVITRAELEGYASKLTTTYNIADSAMAYAQVGPECRDCRARHICLPLQNAALDACDLAEVTLPMELPVSAMARELSLLMRRKLLLEARANGLRDELHHRAVGGESIPGWRLQAKQGSLKWNRPAAEVVALGDMMGCALSKPDVITPRQAVKAGLPEELVNQYASRANTGVELLEDDGFAATAAFGAKHE